MILLKEMKHKEEEDVQNKIHKYTANGYYIGIMIADTNSLMNLSYEIFLMN